MVDDIILDEDVEAGRLVSIAEVRELLEEALETREALTYEQKIALEHARRFARIDAPTSGNLSGKLVADFPGMTERQAVKLADLLPQHIDDVRAILSKGELVLDDAGLEKVLEVIDEFYTS